MFKSISKLTVRTWLGRRGEEQEFNLTSQRFGPRVAIIRWLDGTGDMKISAIKGDGRTSEFSCASEVFLTNPTPEDERRAVEALASLL